MTPGSYRDILVVPLLLKFLTWKQQIISQKPVSKHSELCRKNFSERVQPQDGKSIKYEMMN